MVRFLPPSVDETTTLTFELSVEPADGSAAVSTRVVVTVDPRDVLPTTPPASAESTGTSATGLEPAEARALALDALSPIDEVSALYSTSQNPVVYVPVFTDTTVTLAPDAGAFPVASTITVTAPQFATAANPSVLYDSFIYAYDVCDVQTSVCMSASGTFPGDPTWSATASAEPTQYRLSAGVYDPATDSFVASYTLEFVTTVPSDDPLVRRPSSPAAQTSPTRSRSTSAAGDTEPPICTSRTPRGALRRTSAPRRPAGPPAAPRSRSPRPRSTSPRPLPRSTPATACSSRSPRSAP
ncbi:MAG: hypothetical protein R2715_07315 [Ilumatobacteraceae bacterium]